MTTVEVEELISQLQDFGLSQDDAKIYLALLRSGSHKASQICNITSTDRTKGYRILENLKRLGFVSATFSNPTIYSANDLMASLQEVINRRKFEAERLEKLMIVISKNYQPVEQDTEQTKSPQLNIISGRSSIYRHIATMIKEATEEIYIITTSKDLGMMYYTSIPEFIKAAQKRGITIKVVTEIERRKDSDIINRMKIKNFRVANLPSKGRIVCGKSESLVSGYTEQASGLNSMDDTALVTNSDEFVKNIKSLTQQLWDKGMEGYSLKEGKKGGMKEN